MSKIPFERQKELAIEYKSIKLEPRYRFDILLANSLIVRHGKLPERLGCFTRSMSRDRAKGEIALCVSVVKQKGFE